MQPVDLVYLGAFVIMIFSSVLWLLVYFAHREEVYSTPEPAELPGVTFLVPAYNEEENIEDTLQGLLDLDYPEEKLDIIAINDGSTDSTLEKMKRFEDEVEIIDKENTGKADSMNQALERVDTEIVGCMDADSYPEEDFLHEMVGYFERENVQGVTPALKVREAENWVESVQWAEYIYQIFLRKMFAIFDAQYVLPGPGSLYDTEYLKEIGGWDSETLTEDMEVAFRIFDLGGRIENSTNAYVHTEPPSTLKALFRQRIRWYRGYINNFLRYIHFFGRPRYGNLGFFFLPFNVVWTGIIIFFTVFFAYTLGGAVADAARSYLLTGTLDVLPSISLLSLNFFHVFTVYFATIGIATILISLNTAGEEVKPWKRKAEYVLFLAVYPTLFALFWMAAMLEHAGMGGERW